MYTGRSKSELRKEAYIATNDEYVVDGFTADQWREIARQRDYEQRNSREAWNCVEVLEALNAEELQFMRPASRGSAQPTGCMSI